MLGVERAREILAGARGRRVLVVGDLMLDRYVTGRVNRISPEAPVPVVQVTDEHVRPGGAANVALNIQALGGQAVVAGTVGDDTAGRELMRELSDAGICTDGVVVAPELHTCEKVRVLAERQQIVRVDRESGPGTQAGLNGRLAERICELVPDVAGVILEDYGKGVVTQDSVDAVLRVAGERGVPVGLDPKDNHRLDFSGLALATPNYAEACDAAAVPLVPLESVSDYGEVLSSVGEALRAKWDAELLAITLGAHGMYLVGRGDAPRLIPTRAREVFDVCGAGDTVIATAMLAIVGGATHAEAVMLANYAAGIVVGKVGAATCVPGELTAYIESC